MYVLQQALKRRNVPGCVSTPAAVAADASITTARVAARNDPLRTCCVCFILAPPTLRSL